MRRRDLTQTLAAAATGLVLSGASAPQEAGAEILALKRFGARVDGRTDDTAAWTAAIGSLPAGGGVIHIGGPSLIAPTAILDMSDKPLRITGGALVGAPVGTARSASSSLKIWGALGAPSAFESSIPAGTRSFALRNAFRPGQLLLLSDYPTDPQGSDAYVSGGPDRWGNRARSYANYSNANLRQKRRKELLRVCTASADAFATSQTTFNAYSTQELQFRPVSPAGPVIFDCDLINLSVFCRLAVGTQFNGRCLGSTLIHECCYGYVVRPSLFDAADTDSRVDSFEACRNFQIFGNFTGGRSPGDNALVKVLGCHDFSVDINVDGTGPPLHGLMTDTAFAESWTGYTDLPCGNYSARVTGQGVAGHDVFCSCEPFAAGNGPLSIDVGAASGSVFLKGVTTAVLQGSPARLRIDGSTGVDVQNDRLTYFFASPLSNPRDKTQLRWNSDIRGLPQAWTPTVSGDGAAGTGTYGVQFGQYIRAGNRVSGHAQVNWRAHSGTGHLLVDLPFKAQAGGRPQPIVFGVCRGGSDRSLLAQPLAGGVIPGQSRADVHAASGAIQIGLPDSGELNVSFDYIVDPGRTG